MDSRGGDTSFGVERPSKLGASAAVRGALGGVGFVDRQIADLAGLKVYGFDDVVVVGVLIRHGVGVSLNVGHH